MALTPKQQAFVDAYSGNGVQAARAAGYQGDDDTLATTASRMLRNAKVAQALKQRRASIEAKVADVAAVGRIANRLERQAFWTSTMLDVGADMAHRLKAAELLGRSEADFTDKLTVDAKVTLEQLLAKAAK